MSNFPIHGGAPCTRYAMHPRLWAIGQGGVPPEWQPRLSGRQVRQARLLAILTVRTGWWAVRAVPHLHLNWGAAEVEPRCVGPARLRILALRRIW